MEVTVTGVGMVSALGLGVESGVASISRGESGISPAPEILRTINKLPVGEVRLTNEELHDVLHIRQREHLSRTALLGIWAAREAIADAGIDASGSRVGLVSSTSVGGMDRTERFFETFVADEKAGRLRDVKMHDCAASTEAIAHHCGIGGYRTTVSTACSSAANAIMHGAKLIRHGILDAVIVGGCDALSAFTLNGFKSLMILDEAVCRPFDESRAGLNLGEGAGYIVLQREEERTEGYCNLTGYANRNDAYHQTASSESGEGAYRAMSEALAMAGIGTDDVSYINVHGTCDKEQ